MSDTTINYAILIPEGKGVKYLGVRKLSEYFVVSVKMVDFKQGLYSGKKIEFIFENLVTYYITSTYIPTLIMLVISCTTFYYPLKDFQDRVMVAITALLVEATFFTQVSSTITKTAYLKLVDVWCVFCISIVFLIILALTIVNFIYCIEESSLRIVKVSPIESTTPKLFKRSVMTMNDKMNHIAIATRLNKFLAIGFPIIITAFVLIYLAVSYSSLNIQN